MARRFTISTMTRRLQATADNTIAMAEDIRTKVSIELALSYVALAVSFFAALFAIIPVLVWLGAAGIARKLLDEHQKKTF